jgi:CNT family concentrative nucleoside transporter
MAGFANFSSIAIQIGGIGALAPARRGDLARLGMKSMIADCLLATSSPLSWASLM